MKAAIFDLSTELSGQAAFGMIDGKKNQKIERRYNITSYPTLLVFENGTLVDRKEGFASKKYIVDGLRRVKPDLNTSSVTYG
jgi:thiol-disulfide isomerase/thioredoxin